MIEESMKNTFHTVVSILWITAKGIPLDTHPSNRANGTTDMGKWGVS